MDAGVIVIDMQKDFMVKDFKDRESAARVEKELVPKINRLLSEARAAKMPVIWIKTVFKSDRSDWNLRMKDLDFPVAIEGTPEADILDGFCVSKDDYVVIKKRYSAFLNTDLEELLKKLSLKALIICGIQTHACVRMTAIDAFMRDYRIFIPRDCTGDYDEAAHEASLEYFSKRIAKVLSLDELIDRIHTRDLEFKFEK